MLAMFVLSCNVTVELCIFLFSSRLYSLFEKMLVVGYWPL